MKRRVKRMLSLLLVLLLCMALTPGALAEENSRSVLDTGKTGSATWTLYSDGELVLSGNDSDVLYSPWSDYQDKITKLTIKEGIHNVTYCGFECCVNLKSVTLPKSVHTIEAYAFAGCTALENVTISEGLRWIEAYAFQGCDALKSIKLPGSLETIENNAFSGCDALEKLTIPGNIKNLREETFDHCSSLKELTFQSGVNSVGSLAFAFCTALETVTIPKSMSSIEGNAFGNCSSLRRVNYAGTAKEWKKIQIGFGNEFLELAYAGKKTGDCGGSTKWIYDASTGVLTVKGKGAMQESDLSMIGPAVRQAVIKSGVTAIESNAFSGCGALQSITIPKSVKTIETCAFSDCTVLTDVYYAGTAAQWNSINMDREDNGALPQAKLHCTPTLSGSLNAKGKPVLTWEKVDGTAKYQIWRSTTGKEGSFKLLATRPGNRYTHSRAVTGTTYYYKIKAVAENGTKSAYSKVVKLTAASAAPKLSGSLNAKGKPTLSWTAADGAVKYQVWRSTTGEDGSFKLITTKTGTTYTHGKAAAGKTFYYKVRAVMQDGSKGAFTKIVKLTASLPAPKLTGELNAKGKPTLSWTAVDGAAKYQVWRSTTGEAGSFTLVATKTGTQMTNSKVAAGATVYYKVRAVMEDGTKGAYSAVIRLQLP